MLNNPQALVNHLHNLHDQLQKALLAALTAADVKSTVDDLSAVADVRGGDTIYAIDMIAEEIIDAYCEEWAAAEGPLVLISEGIEDAGWKVFPHDAREEDARFLLIFDPIDGTRNLMFNKRSSWALSGIAPNKGRETTLVDIEVAMMTELPTSRALLADQLWAIKGDGAFRRIRNLHDGSEQDAQIRPSQETTLSHGFSSIAKFFPPGKAAMAEFEELLLEEVAPNTGENPLVFDDQYMTTGGQLYELMVGHDRFTADLRPVFFKKLGLPPKLVCHPYDICVELIAREAGVIVVDEHGNRLSALLDIRADVSWCGYANQAVHDRVQPVLERLLTE